jgi:hypothetical protein
MNLRLKGIVALCLRECLLVQALRLADVGVEEGFGEPKEDRGPADAGRGLGSSSLEEA